MNRLLLFSFRLVFLCCWLGVVLPTYAQSIHYEYDAAGNRTARIYYSVQMPQQRSASQKLDTVVVNKQPGSLSVRVYPNPTKGDLFLSLSGLDLTESVYLRLYDPNGTLVYQSKASMGTTAINMLKMISGWYVLRVSSSKEELNFKIIRK